MAEPQLECVVANWDTDRPVLEYIRREVFINEQRIPNPTSGTTRTHPAFT